VIVVDDRSEDGTARMVRIFMKKFPNLRLVEIKDKIPSMAPKKNALFRGIQRARGEIILTTDADCVPGPHWLSSMVAYFEPGVGLVAGFNPYKSSAPYNNTFHQMLALDFFAMAAISAAFIGLGFPISCSGGNLAYRKSVFQQVGGFARIDRWISGDDMLFLEKVRDHTSWKIRYAIEPESFVPTLPPPNFKSFIHQRIRYASKCPRLALPVTLGLTGIYFLNLLILMAGALSFFNIKWLPIFLTSFFMKMLFEWNFLKSASKIFQQKISLKLFFLSEGIHPFYIVCMGLLGVLLPFQWHGEIYRRKSTLYFPTG
ncbi:MAG: glycosyltransferase, partial [Calditrichaeota bacterium]